MSLLRGRRLQRGFTLIEIVMALGVSALIASAATATIYQVFMNNTKDTTRMTAVKQVENALHFIVRDVQMAQEIQTDGLAGDEVLRLRWVDWDDVSYQVTYYLDNGELTREYQRTGEDGQTTSVCRYILQLSVSPQPYETGDLTVNITATIGGSHPSTEQREVTISPRAAS